jgi:hypothetical protein
MGKRRVLFASAAVVAAGIGAGGIATAHGHDERFHVTLRADNETGDNDISETDGRGSVRLTLEPEKGDTPGMGEVCFDLRFDRSGTPNRGHIHSGAAGVNGGIVVPLFELVGMPEDERNDALERGRLDKCVPATTAQINAIIAMPSAFYVNLHNARWPAGSMRGQVG